MGLHNSFIQGKQNRQELENSTHKPDNGQSLGVCDTPLDAKYTPDSITTLGLGIYSFSAVILQGDMPVAQQALPSIALAHHGDKEKDCKVILMPFLQSRVGLKISSHTLIDSLNLQKKRELLRFMLPK